MAERESVDIEALFSLTYGLYVVSACANGQRSGLIANAVMQITEDPVRVAVSLHKQSLTHELAEKGGRFAVSVLARGAPIELIQHFGFKTGRKTDKFLDYDHYVGEGDCPVLKEFTVAAVEAEVKDVVDAGLHTLFVGRATAARTFRAAEALTYDYYRDVMKGKTSPFSPTYKARKAGEKDRKNAVITRKGQGMQKYICDICAWVYNPETGDPDNGVEPGTAWEDVPEEWLCPICGAPKENFSPIEE